MYFIRVGTSAGGARAKAVVAWNAGTREIRSGQFDVAEGFEHWILKFDDVGKDLEHLDYRLRGTHAYEQLLMAATRLALDDAATTQLFLRMAFNVMARNCDDHTKNFSFRLKRVGAWELAPAYDVTHAHNPSGEWTYQHLMSINGRFADITREDLLVVAERFSVRRPADRLKDVRAALDSWPDWAAQAGLSPAEVDDVAKDFRLL